MNHADKMKIADSLRGNIAGWMMERGRVISDCSRSNAYTSVRMAEVEWRGSRWEITWVDGMACRIEKG